MKKAHLWIPGTMIVLLLSVAAFGQLQPPSGGGSATTITAGTTTVASGTTNQFLYNNAGVLGNLALFAVNAQTGTYQVLQSDFTACKTIPVASGTFNVTLVASGSQPTTGQCIDVINYGSGVVTIVRSGQNINGGTASLTLNAASAAAPSWAHVVSDGTNYEASVVNPIAGGSSFSYFNGDSGEKSLSGSYVTLQTTSSLTLAAGACLRVDEENWTTTGSTTYSLFMDSTLVWTWTQGSNGYFVLNQLLYCNNNGVQNAQSVMLLQSKFTTNDGAAQGWSLYNVSNTRITPTAVDMTGLHVLTYQATGTSSTARSYWFHVTTE